MPAWIIKKEKDFLLLKQNLFELARIIYHYHTHMLMPININSQQIQSLIYELAKIVGPDAVYYMTNPKETDGVTTEKESKERHERSLSTHPIVFPYANEEFTKLINLDYDEVKKAAAKRTRHYFDILLNISNTVERIHELSNGDDWAPYKAAIKQIHDNISSIIVTNLVVDLAPVRIHIRTTPSAVSAYSGLSTPQSSKAALHSTAARLTQTLFTTPKQSYSSSPPHENLTPMILEYSIMCYYIDQRYLELCAGQRGVKGFFSALVPGSLNKKGIKQTDLTYLCLYGKLNQGTIPYVIDQVAKACPSLVEPHSATKATIDTIKTQCPCYFGELGLSQQEIEANKKANMELSSINNTLITSTNPDIQKSLKKQAYELEHQKYKRSSSKDESLKITWPAAERGKELTTPKLISLPKDSIPLAGTPHSTFKPTNPLMTPSRQRDLGTPLSIRR